ncbi:MAG: PBP1A family penicillin-binding protein [Labilithrix sp.]|nr:PBP1A family penicillin-binding protein [Labilithrix sp.]MCW5815390.1 PBP1A family penicillin-binding protein [Labilithrix sp.]
MSSAPSGVTPDVPQKKLLDEVNAPAPKPANEPPIRRVLRWTWKWSKRAAIAGVALSVLAVIAGWLLIRHYEEGLPSVAELEKGYRPSQVTRVLAKDGTTLAEIFTERRTVVKIEDLPRHVKLAVLAAEDASFYEHEGINYLGIARAMVVNLRAGRTRQGGSTITQQVVKNILLETNERSYKRKMKEALLARRLEQELCPECGADQAGKDRRKDKILELYLNHIYLGHGRYGIEEAAKDDFGKSAKDLTIAEAAMLAGVPAGPELFSPKRDLQRALTRRAFVLDQMKAKHFINDAEYEAAKNEAVRLAPSHEIDSELAPEAVAIAKKMLLDLEPERGPRGGFTITTTIDPALQAAARKALRDNVGAYDKRHALLAPVKAQSVAAKGKGKPKDPPFEGTPKFESHKVLTGTVIGSDDTTGTLDVRVGTVVGSVKLADYKRYNPQNLPPSAFAEVGARVRVSLLAPVPNAAANVHGDATTAVAKVPLRLELGPEAALVVLDVRSRNVLAIAGNYEAQNGGLDRATQSHRQPGSTFKPIVYSYAIHSRRYTPATLIDVRPRAFGNYKPSNYEGWTAADPLRLREALAKSVNIASVAVLDDVGPANVVDWAKALGVTSKLEPDLSLALGSYEVKPIELAGAYATFAAGGMYEEPRLVTRIVGPDGKDVELRPPPPPRRVLEPAEAFVITNMMESVVDHGTAQSAKSLGRRVAGKTGTSNDVKDTWFAGFSPEIVAISWVGYDDNKPLGSGEAGGTTALPAWVSVMDAAHKGKPRSEFARPPGVKTVAIDPVSGKLKAEGTEGDAIDEVFLDGTEPTETADPPEPTPTLVGNEETAPSTGADGGTPLP